MSHSFNSVSHPSGLGLARVWHQRRKCEHIINIQGRHYMATTSFADGNGPGKEHSHTNVVTCDSRHECDTNHTTFIIIQALVGVTTECVHSPGLSAGLVFSMVCRWLLRFSMSSMCRRPLYTHTLNYIRLVLWRGRVHTLVKWAHLKAIIKSSHVLAGASELMLVDYTQEQIRCNCISLGFHC